MDHSRVFLLAAAAGIVLAAGSCVFMDKPASPVEPVETAEERATRAAETIEEWDDLPTLAARLMIAEYGAPSRIEPERLVWNDNGPWRRTVVWNVRSSTTEDSAPGIVEQTVDYPLTEAQAADLASFDKELAFDPRSQELSARSDHEQFNVLLLNLADDVAHRRLLPDQARRSYVESMELEASGKTSPDLQRLRITP